MVETKGLILLITPIPAPTFAQILSICFAQVNLSSSSTPKHVQLYALGTGTLLNKIGIGAILFLILKDDPIYIYFVFFG